MMYLALALCLATGPAAPDRSAKLADAYVDAVAKVNDSHVRKPKAQSEAELRDQLPKKATRALDELLGLDEGEELAQSLARCARASLDLDRLEDFERCKNALTNHAPEGIAALGTAVSRERFIVLGEGGLDTEYLEHFADVLDDVLAAYDEVFGFEEFSKVPGKKLRVRVHLEERITRPPHFAPQFPWHSEVDFPVIDAERLRSPTPDGKFLFYGLCHELGHVIAMWGNLRNEEDHHAWAHYTGIVIVEHMAEARKPAKWLKDCKDVRWRSIEKERERLGRTGPGTKDRDGVLALLLALHDEVGPKALGGAINALDREDKRLCINLVRYYTFDQLSDALRAGTKSRKLRKRLVALFGG